MTSSSSSSSSSLRSLKSFVPQVTPPNSPISPSPPSPHQRKHNVMGNDEGDDSTSDPLNDSIYSIYDSANDSKDPTNSTNDLLNVPKSSIDTDIFISDGIINKVPINSDLINSITYSILPKSLPQLDDYTSIIDDNGKEEGSIMNDSPFNDSPVMNDDSPKDDDDDYKEDCGDYKNVGEYKTR